MLLALAALVVLTTADSGGGGGGWGRRPVGRPDGGARRRMEIDELEEAYRR